MKFNMADIAGGAKKALGPFWEPNDITHFITLSTLCKPSADGILPPRFLVVC